MVQRKLRMIIKLIAILFSVPIIAIFGFFIYYDLPVPTLDEIDSELYEFTTPAPFKFGFNAKFAATVYRELTPRECEVLKAIGIYTTCDLLAEGTEISPAGVISEKAGNLTEQSVLDALKAECKVYAPKATAFNSWLANVAGGTCESLSIDWTNEERQFGIFDPKALTLKTIELDASWFEAILVCAFGSSDCYRGAYARHERIKAAAKTSTQMYSTIRKDINRCLRDDSACPSGSCDDEAACREAVQALLKANEVRLAANLARHAAFGKIPRLIPRRCGLILPQNMYNYLPLVAAVALDKDATGLRHAQDMCKKESGCECGPDSIEGVDWRSLGTLSTEQQEQLNKEREAAVAKKKREEMKFSEFCPDLSGFIQKEGL